MSYCIKESDASKDELTKENRSCGDNEKVPDLPKKFKTKRTCEESEEDEYNPVNNDASDHNVAASIQTFSDCNENVHVVRPALA